MDENIDFSGMHQFLRGIETPCSTGDLALNSSKKEVNNGVLPFPLSKAGGEIRNCVNNTINEGKDTNDRILLPNEDLSFEENYNRIQALLGPINPFIGFSIFSYDKGKTDELKFKKGENLIVLTFLLYAIKYNLPIPKLLPLFSEYYNSTAFNNTENGKEIYKSLAFLSRNSNHTDYNNSLISFVSSGLYTCFNLIVPRFAK